MASSTTTTPAVPQESGEEVLRQSVEDLLQRPLEDEQWKGRGGSLEISSPKTSSQSRALQTQDPWGFAELPATRERGAGPTSIDRFAKEVSLGEADLEARFTEFRLRDLEWVQEVMHPRIQCWGIHFWENFEDGAMKDWDQARSKTLSPPGPYNPEHHQTALWWAGFEGPSNGYPLPAVPRVVLTYRDQVGFPILREGVVLDRSTGQWPEHWVLRDQDGNQVLPGRFTPLPGWAKGVNPGTTNRWRKEVETNFRSDRLGGKWRWR